MLTPTSSRRDCRLPYSTRIDQCPTAPRVIRRAASPNSISARRRARSSQRGVHNLSQAASGTTRRPPALVVGVLTISPTASPERPEPDTREFQDYRKRKYGTQSSGEANGCSPEGVDEHHWTATAVGKVSCSSHQLTTELSCVAMIRAVSPSRSSSSTDSAMSTFPRSNAAEGSSTTAIRGLFIKSRASATRCCSPPLSEYVGSEPYPSKPTRCSAKVRVWARASRPNPWPTKARFRFRLTVQLSTSP